jgi:hypothetical protein
VLGARKADGGSVEHVNDVCGLGRMKLALLNPTLTHHVIDHVHLRNRPNASIVINVIYLAYYVLIHEPKMVILGDIIYHVLTEMPLVLCLTL